MNRMTRDDWEFYAMLRKLRGKKVATMYKQKKRAERNLSRPAENKWTLAVDRGMDGYIIKRFFAGEPFTDEDWNDLVRQETLHKRYAAYDCTGQLFTSWIEKFETPNGTWVYHYIACDC